MYAEDGPGSADITIARNQCEASLISGESHGDCAVPKASNYHPFASFCSTRMADVTKATAAKNQQGELRV